MKYKALSNGTLNFGGNYRFVEKDAIVELPPGFVSKWLIPLEVANKMPVPLLTSVTHFPTQNGLDAMKAMTDAMPGTKQYNDSIAALKRLEDAQDKKPVPVPPATPEVRIEIPGEEQVGTGNQDVA